jgi:hypothetical protein
MFGDPLTHEYMYIGKITVKRSFLKYYDSTDPEIKVIDLEKEYVNREGVLWITSKLMADKYSVRNWIFRILNTAYENGARMDDFTRFGFSGSCAVEAFQLPKIEANRFWGKFIDQRSNSVFSRPLVDSLNGTSISLMHVIKEKSERTIQFQFDNLIDSNLREDNGFLVREINYDIAGPEHSPFTLDFDKDLKQLEKNIENLTTEAINYKEYTIPPFSTVDLSLDEYGYVEVNEEKDCVLFIFRNGKQYFTLAFQISTSSWIDDYVTLNPQDKEPTDDELRRHKLAVKYLAAIILHDFWIPDYRERNKVYNPNRVKPQLNRNPWARTDLDGRTNIYIPRIKYYSNDREQEENLNNSKIKTASNGVFQNRNYGRSAHIRNLTQTNLNPNPAQVILANEYNLKVPKGYTFVRPSIGNEEELKEEIKEKNRFYISRTAAKTLFNVEVFQNSKHSVKWQKFEYDVSAYCREVLGFTLLPRRLRKRGDGGIDLLCFKQHGKRYQYWLIQCKCWSKNRPVGTPILRELYGAGKWSNELSEDQKKNLNFMIITTSYFSSDPDFLNLVEAENTVLIDGEMFANRIFPSNMK